MNIKITGKQIDLGDALQRHVGERIDQAVSKYFDRAVTAAVVFSKDSRAFFKCEALVTLPTGLQAQAHGNADEIYAAFEKAAERIEKQVRRHKRRLKNHHARQQDPIDVIEAQSYVLPALEDEDPNAEAMGGSAIAADDEAPPAIIAETRIDIQTLSVGDAVMQMELRHSPFLMFRNTANGRLNVVFQRDDGNVGWVDPDMTETPALA
ncbi:MAG: ribosome-associated translation inhibitor RaiA [Pseudomonadota bacterium]